MEQSSVFEGPDKRITPAGALETLEQPKDMREVKRIVVTSTRAAKLLRVYRLHALTFFRFQNFGEWALPLFAMSGRPYPLRE